MVAKVLLALVATVAQAVAEAEPLQQQALVAEAASLFTINS
jgi:hypothetical protein